MLEQALVDDVEALSTDKRARTFYEVVLLADGAPAPVCCIVEDETEGALGEGRGNYQQLETTAPIDLLPMVEQCAD